MASDIHRADQHERVNRIGDEGDKITDAPPNLLPRRSASGVRYFIAPLMVAAACAVKLLLDPLIEQESPFLVLLAAVMVSAWYGGFGPGLLATVLAALAADFFFLAPYYSFRLLNFGQGVWLATFALEGCLISLLSGALHIARRRGEANALTANEHEKAFQASEESYRIVAETASDAIITIDEESVIRYVNQSAGKIFGYSTNELVGQKLPMLMPERFRASHRQGVRRYTETGVKHIAWESIELPGLHKSGREIMLELSFGEFKRDGKQFFTGIARDITERKRAERRAAAQHAATRTLAEATTLGEAAPRILEAIGEGLEWQFGALWLVDKANDVLRCVEVWSAPGGEASDFAATTRSITLARGVGLPGRAWASDKPAWIADLTQDANFPRADSAAQSGLRAAFAFPIALGGETLGVIELFSRDAQPPDEKLLEMMTIIGGQMGQFIERQRVEEERVRLLERERAAHAVAEANSRAKDEFLATLSHELRTPLTPIIGWTHMLGRSEMLTDANRAIGLTAIEKNAHALARLINDLLDMSAILNNKMRIERTPVSLADALREAVETVEPQAVTRNVEIQLAACDPATESVLISGDRVRLVQVFWNLLANAVKFSRDAGVVRVSCDADASDARVHIEDDGQGIAPEFLPFVFERFRQADGSATRQHGGMGIGLALVKTFVEAHGGAVSAASEGRERGSRFTVRLPRVQVPTVAPDERDRALEVEAYAAKNHRILIVEDETDTLQMLQLLFERRGYRVCAYASATDTMRAATKGERFDIIITDLGLPEMSGHELLERLRRVPGFETIPAVALTGFAATKDIEESLRSGFTAHLAKPIDPSALVARIEELLDASTASLSRNGEIDSSSSVVS